MPNKRRRKVRNVFWSFHYTGATSCTPPPDLPDYSQVVGGPVILEAEELENSSSSGKARYNECEHWRYKAVFNPHPPVEAWNSNFHNPLVNRDEQVLINDPHNQILQAVTPEDESINAFADGWRLMRTQISWPVVYDRVYRGLRRQVTLDREISLLNFTYELRELKRMFHLWARKLSYLRNVANGVLNAKYGWRPFLSDVCAMVGAMTSYRKRLKHLLKTQGTLRYYRKQVDAGPMQIVQHGPYSVGNPAVSCIGNVVAGYHPTYCETSARPLDHFVRGTVKYSYTCLELSEMQAEIRGFMQAFGLALDPQILWDAIPFSFIVDWFWQVGDWLHDKLSLDPFPVVLRIHEACYTHECRQLTACTMKPQHGDLALDANAFEPVVVSLQGKRFMRHIHYPSRDDLNYAGWVRQLLEKVLTGSLLVYTNTKRHGVRPRIPRRVRPKRPRRSKFTREIGVGIQQFIKWSNSAAKWIPDNR